MKVTILGAGRMGSAMAQRLADSHHQVTIWDRRADRAAPLEDGGIAIDLDAASAVADAAVVVTMLTNGEAVQAVAERMLSSMRSDAVWVQASTVGAAWAARHRGLAEAHGRVMLDAPVSGSTGPARTGTPTWLVAGPGQALEVARPVLDALGERVIVVGTRQEASRLKLVVNAWMTAATVAMADALDASNRLGVPPQAFLQVLSAGPLGMPYALLKAEQMTTHDYTPGFPVELALKDIRLLEQSLGSRNALIHALEERLAGAVEAGHASDDLAAVAAVR